MSDTKKMVGEILRDIVDAAKSGGSRISVGLLSTGSELGPEEMIRGGLLAQQENPGVRVVMIGPRPAKARDLEWIETEDCEKDIADAMEQALREKRIAGAVALHYPFPLGVTTIGRVLTPAKGKPMILASTTGTSSAHRGESMVLNALYGIATAKAMGMADPTVGILNVESAQPVFRSLNALKEAGYPFSFGASLRKDGGSVLRGNDILGGAVDVCVADSLTGNVLVKMFSSYSTGGGYEALGWGYGPSCGDGWPHVVSIISRASGAPVIANAVAFTARVAGAGLPELVQEELKKARKAGLDAVLEGLRPKAAVAEEEIAVPPAEPTDEEIHGVDVLEMENAARELWKAGIYAEAAMGCTGPVVKLNKKHEERALEILKKAGYL